MPGGPPEEQRTVWLFGDSFVDADDTRSLDDRVGAAFIHNSIGVSRCAGNDFEIEYHWGRDADGSPVAFFDPGRASPYWWPFDGFVHDGALYVGLLEVEPAPPRGPLMLPFRLHGMSLARIDDPSAPPSTWRPRVLRLSGSRTAFPGAAMVVDGSHVLMFGFRSGPDGRQARFLSRLPLATLDGQVDDLEPHVETLARDGRWIPGFLPAEARILIPDNATEMSVARHPELPAGRRWLAVYGSPLQVAPDGTGPAHASGAIYARTAPRPEGPWSERILLHEIREVSTDRRRRAAGTFCYAAKEHPAFAGPDELVLTYVCNLARAKNDGALSAVKTLQRDMQVYVPRVVTMETPAALRAGPDEVTGPETY